MKIGIIEICEPNHYTAVAALAQTYAVDPNNDITIFTIPSIKSLLTFSNSRIHVLVKEDDESVAQFLKKVVGAKLDRLHINTISRYFKEFAFAEWPDNVYFTIHNINLWFDNPVSTQIRSLIFEYKERLGHKKLDRDLIQPLILFLKDFKRQYFRYKFIRKISRKSFSIIVYSESQKTFLSKFISADNIIIFPFCLHAEIEDTSVNNRQMRICIPGSVSNRRRTYVELFKMLNKNNRKFQKQLVIDLLGYIPKSDSNLIPAIEAVRQKGIEVYYNLDFIGLKEFDERLGKADIILGNLRTQVNVNSKYGETKETGVVFNMIKAGKPGMFPKDYPIDEKLKEICIYFESYDELALIIAKLIIHREQLEALKDKARLLVKQFEPEFLYPALMRNN